MKIVILGGGISGLSALWRLSRSFSKADLELIEASPRLGGWIQTVVKDGFEFETGPRTFSSSRSPFLLQLISELGLEPLFSLPKAKERYLWTGNRLRRASTLFWQHAWRLCREPFIARGTKEETIYEFALRRFGRVFADLFIDPIVLGIFAGDCRTLSMQAAFPQLCKLEQEAGSLLLGMLSRSKKKAFPAPLFTLKNGMESLVQTLGSRLQPYISLNQRVERLRQEGNQWIVETDQKSIKADVLFSALPPQVLSSLLPDMPTISSSSLRVVNLGFHTLRLPKSGYGYLVPSKEREDLLGMVFDSEIFGGEKTKLTAMIRPHVKDPKEVAIKALKRHLHIEALPDAIEVTEAKHAIAQIKLGQKQELLEWEKSLNRLYLLGNYLEGPSVDQCIARSEKIVSGFLKKSFD